MTKVILLKDITKLGQKGDVKEVKDGYLRNFLLPKGLVEMASPENIRKIIEIKAKSAAEKEKSKNELEKALAKIGDRALELEMNADEKGHLFKKITEKDLVKKLSELGVSGIKEEWLVLKEAIKKTGEYEAKIEIPSSESRDLKIIVKKTAPV